jgi:hypothetical protein
VSPLKIDSILRLREAESLTVNVSVLGCVEHQLAPPIKRSVLINSPWCAPSFSTTGGLEAVVDDLIEEVRFARDSPLEGAGFEPSVPRSEQHFFETAPEPSDDKPAW